MKIIFGASNRRLNVRRNVNEIFIKSIGYEVQLNFCSYKKYFFELYEAILLKRLVSLYFLCTFQVIQVALEITCKIISFTFCH